MAEDFDFEAPAAESGGADAEVSRAEAALERAATRSGVIDAPEPDRAPQAPPAPKEPAPPATPATPPWEDRFSKARESWNDPAHRRMERQLRREEGRRRAMEKQAGEEAQRLLQEKLDNLQSALLGKGEEEPDFELDQKAYIDKQFQTIRDFVESKFKPLEETFQQRQEREAQEARQAQESEQFKEWAQDRAQWAAEAEREWVGGDQRRGQEYAFYKRLVADTCFDQGRMLVGEGPQAEAFARSAMLSMMDMAERFGHNPAALIEGMGRMQMMTALRHAHALGIIEMAGNGAPRAPAASPVSDAKEFIESAEAGGATPPPAARTTNGKAPREGDFTRWALNTLAQRGGKSGMPEVIRRGKEKYGADWPGVYRDLQAQIRTLARG